MVIERKGQRESRTAGDYINLFVENFFFDAEKIYNINMSEEILELLEELKEELPEKQWSSVLRKAVKKTKVKQRDQALQELSSLGEISLED